MTPLELFTVSGLPMGKTPEAVAAAKALFNEVVAYCRARVNIDFGDLHCVLADGNYEEEFIRSTLADTREPETAALCRHLLQFSEADRRDVASEAVGIVYREAYPWSR